MSGNKWVYVPATCLCKCIELYATRLVENAGIIIPNGNLDAIGPGKSTIIQFLYWSALALGRSHILMGSAPSFGMIPCWCGTIPWAYRICSSFWIIPGCTGDNPTYSWDLWLLWDCHTVNHGIIPHAHKLFQNHKCSLWVWKFILHHTMGTVHFPVTSYASAWYWLGCRYWRCLEHPMKDMQAVSGNQIFRWPLLNHNNNNPHHHLILLLQAFNIIHSYQTNIKWKRTIYHAVPKIIYSKNAQGAPLPRFSHNNLIDA